MKNLINITILLLAITSLFSVETATIDLSTIELPSKVVDAQTKLDADLEQAQLAYLAVVEKAKETALKAMEKERSRTKDGVVALAIQAKMDAITKLEEPKDLLGRPIVDDRMEKELYDTKWQWSNTVVTLNSNMTVSGAWNAPAKWSHVDGVFNITFDNGDSFSGKVVDKNRIDVVSVAEKGVAVVSTTTVPLTRK